MGFSAPHPCFFFFYKYAGQVMVNKQFRYFAFLYHKKSDLNDTWIQRGDLCYINISVQRMLSKNKILNEIFWTQFIQQQNKRWESCPSPLKKNHYKIKLSFSSRNVNEILKKTCMNFRFHKYFGFHNNSSLREIFVKMFTKVY